LLPNLKLCQSTTMA